MDEAMRDRMRPLANDEFARLLGSPEKPREESRRIMTDDQINNAAVAVANELAMPCSMEVWRRTYDAVKRGLECELQPRFRFVVEVRARDIKEAYGKIDCLEARIGVSVEEAK